MRRKYLSLLLGLVAMLLPTIAGAYDFEAGGLYYDVVSFTELTCKVAQSPSDNPYSGDIVVPDVVTYNNRELKVVEIANSAFLSKKIDSVVIGDNVERIGDSAFSSSTVKNIIFGKNVVELGRSAFSSCQNIVSVKLPEKLTTVSSHLFSGCKNLKEVIFPDGTETIEQSAFQSSGIEEITLPATVKSIGNYAFLECPEMRSLTLPTYIETIPLYMCKSCKSLTSITIPPSVKLIRSEAFSYCSSLQTVDLGMNLKTIERNAFTGCDKINIINSYAPIAPETASAFESKVYINSILYVPDGAKASYAASTNWKEFWNIEDKLPNDLSVFSFQINVNVPDGHASVNINGVDSDKYYAVGGTTTKIIFTPDYGYKLSKVLVNDNDVISEITNNILNIENVSDAILVTAMLEQIQVPVTVSTSEGGTVTSNVGYGSIVKYDIAPAEGWELHSVSFNGYEVTSQLEDNTYTTPAITTPSSIQVVFESISGAAPTVLAPALKVVADGDVVTINGASDNATVRVYTIDGRNIVNTTDKSLQLRKGNVYVICVEGQTYKIAL